MRKISPVSAFVYIATMAALLIVLIPGLASAAAPTSTDIWRVVSVANNQNQQVLNSFASAAVQAKDISTLDSLRSNAHASLEDIYFTAEAQINGYVDANPDLEGDGAEAKAQLLADHNAAHYEVDSIYETVRDALERGTTTTTTTEPKPTTTTTTEPKPTTTTTTEPKPTTTTTTEPDRTTTTTTVPPVDEGDGRDEDDCSINPDTCDDATEPVISTRSDDDSDTGAAASPPPGTPPPTADDVDPMMDHIHAVADGQLWGTPLTSVEAVQPVLQEG